MAVAQVGGILRGMGREVPCQLTVWKERSSTGREYTRCRIDNESADLPDGTYLICFAGHNLPTRKWEGHWLLRYLPRKIQLADVA